MPDGSDRKSLARSAYAAYETNDRDLIDSLLAEDFVFYSPPDPGIDRATYFERCWPNAQRLERFELVRLIRDGDEVVVTYEATRTDGTSFRNTEILTFEGDKMKRTEVYFGWNLE
jgi:ketosteroid isomerase-like protein